MESRNLKLVIAATVATAAFIGTSGVIVAQGMKVGELKDLYAWVNKMPPGPPSIIAIGRITAPTPCYDALADYAGDSKSNPPIYRVKVTLHLQQPPGVMCIQRLTDIQFRYRQPNYVGNHEKMEIFSDQDSKTIPIESVQ
jgi:hypothetical protein